ncbi:hypothetical protein QWY82_10190 [Simiduia curdlanivorans]|uniref:Uncharacterized protein n=1 Tax=Simiduia curdlanivorans TaxID=1492769 RepID=A0ABV8V1A8_9GAMM|nr:hypothetical protein [Simiduia curdlanivorans]MDN3639179.1 hypothetical protein [Simiduia curdlanivorans]
MAVFDYLDFGPQVIASEVIGNEWWQWQPHGDSRPRAYDVKVVVFKQVSIKEVMQKYPVNQGMEKDYRYIDYEQASTYLDDRINENVIEDVTARLQETKRKIIAALGE